MSEHPELLDSGSHLPGMAGTEIPPFDLPEAKVESFLAAHAEHFEKLESAWQDIHGLQDDYTARCLQIVRYSDGGVPEYAKQNFGVVTWQPNSARKQRRSNDKVSKQNSQQLVRAARAEASNAYFKEGLAESPVDEIEERIENIRSQCLEEEVTIIDATGSSEEARAMRRSISEARLDLVTGYMRGFYLQETGAQAVAALLEDEATTAPFLARISELSEIAKTGFVEYPGLLEAVATHIHSGRSTIVTNAAERAVDDNSSRRAAFLERYIGEGAANQLRRESASVFATITWVTRALETQGSHQPGEIARLLAEDSAAWPKDIQELYATQLKGQRLEIVNQFRTDLRPHTRPSWLPGSEQPGNGGRSDQSGQGKSAKRGKSPSAVETLPEVEASAEPAAANRAKEIGRFAILKGTDMRRMLAIERFASLDDLLADDVVAEYLERYSNNERDPLQSLVKAALSHLTHQPFDGVNTRALPNLRFRVRDPEGDIAPDKPYHLHRFKPVSFADDAEFRGSEARRRTRIKYAVLNEAGEPMLAVRSVFRRDDNKLAYEQL